MVYPTMETVNATNDLSQILVYFSTVTGGLFGAAMLWSFFLVLLIGGYWAQKRTTGRSRPETVFAAASIATAVLCFIMLQVPGIINWIHAVFAIALSVISVIWLVLSNE